jgi:hypothetical protein
MTTGAMAAMHQLGIRPGVDVHVASHANKGSALLFGYEQALIMAEFDPAEVVTAMYEMLAVLMDGGTPNRRSTVHARLRSR